MDTDPAVVRALKRTVLTVALLNLGYMAVELTVSLAVGWSLRRRAGLGKILALIILLPALAAGWMAVVKVGDPEPPDPLGLVTAWTLSGWPDLVLGVVIVALNASAAKEIWETATEEQLAARALAGDLDED